MNELNQNSLRNKDFTYKCEVRKGSVTTTHSLPLFNPKFRKRTIKTKGWKKNGCFWTINFFDKFTETAFSSEKSDEFPVFLHKYKFVVKTIKIIAKKFDKFELKSIAENV